MMQHLSYFGHGKTPLQRPMAVEFHVAGHIEQFYSRQHTRILSTIEIDTRIFVQ